MADKIFADGMFFKRPRAGAPEFVKGSISVKVDEAIEFLKKNASDGWVNLDLKKAKGTGNLYLELNTFRKPGDAPQAQDRETDPAKVEVMREFRKAHNAAADAFGEKGEETPW